MRLIPITLAWFCCTLTACWSRPAPKTQVTVDAPPIPTDMNLPETHVLTARAPDDSEVLYYRNVVLVAFDDTVPGSAIRAFLERYHAVIIGGADFVGPRRGYVLQVPDPGPTLAAVDNVVKRIEKEPGVAEATWLTYKGHVRSLGRKPKTRRQYDTTLPPGTTDDDLERRDFFSEMKKHAF
jgi:hypothetical protein